MRILQISSAKNFGGGERHLVDLCAGLAKSGHEIFAAVRRENSWLGKLRFLPEENISFAPLRNSLDVWSARLLARFVKEKNIEIVHAHLARDYPIAALAARRTKTRLILTRHLTIPLNSAHKILLPKDAKFIAVSEAARRQIIKQNILPPEQIQLIYNGIDARRFAGADKNAGRNFLIRQLNLRARSPLVGVVGEIAAHKGQIDFVRAADEVLKRFPDAEFLIAGRDASPSKKNEYALRGLIEELGLKNKIHLVGWLEDAAPFLAALDVYVSASHFESFGLATVEALAAGCAVVAAETDGARETIEDGRTGKLIPVKNSSALAAAIVELLSDEKTRQNLSANGARAASEKFTVERMVAETEKLYRDIVETRAK